jgi:hypothetical protein
MKKLTVDDIPEEYNYAAVNRNRSAYAFKNKPNRDFMAWTSIGDFFWIGDEFDNLNWQNSLLEKKVLKRLTMGDIPKDYAWAAVDPDGNAYAFKSKPLLLHSAATWIRNDSVHWIGDRFDTTNWENSLIGGDPHVIEILNNKKKRKMEGATLESCKFEFTQDANCISNCDKIEKIKITHQSDLGLDRTKGGFFVLKTKGWSISSEDDIKKLLDRIRLAMKKE